MNVIFCDTIPSDAYIYVIANHDISRANDYLQKICGDEYAKHISSLCSDIKYKEHKAFDVYLDGDAKKIIVIGAGEKNKVNRASIEKLGGAIYTAISDSCGNISKKHKECGVKIFVSSDIDHPNSYAYISSGISLKSYVFDKYKKEKAKFTISELHCKSENIDDDKDLYNKLRNICESVNFTRDLVNEPANVVFPQTIVDKVTTEFKQLGIKVQVLGRQQMKDLGMNALLGVAQGSSMEPYTLVCEYVTDESVDKIALVGKGVTFDSGGISIKPSNNMAEMKGDMAGSGVVLGAIKALAANKTKCNVIAAVGLVENMPSGTAQRPGDVVTAIDGTTIEVDNTDAEGRLVLADVISYVGKTYKPTVIIDVATLTGAIGVALGKEYAGLFSNDDDLCNRLCSASSETGEKIWRLPTHEAYTKDIKSNIADIKNVGSGNGGGSITAAKFLEHFVTKDTKWAHIDIAYTEWCTADLSLSQRGATGFGVRLLCELVENKI